MTDPTQLCPDCEERPQRAAGLCNRCYKRRSRRARGIPQRSKPDPTQLCPDCEERYQEKAGLCERCYDRRRRRAGGSPLRDRTLSYAGMHMRLRAARGAASNYICVDCHNPADDWSYRGGCPSERMTEGSGMWCPDVTCYQPRCKSCHYAYDNRHGSKTKLTADIVRKARRRYAEGTSAAKLAVEYGVSHQVMWRTVTRKNWKHIT